MRQIFQHPFVPFTEADVCWCQPFDGPAHPQCPMHGELSAITPEEMVQLENLPNGEPLDLDSYVTGGR